jgi:predicted acylesterase/phospholipase RssA
MISINNNNWLIKQSDSGRGLHCVFGGGVARAVVCSIGVLEKLKELQYSFQTLGGVSAGSIIPLMAAAGIPLEELRQLVSQCDFRTFVKPNYRHLFQLRLGWRILNRRRYMKTLPVRGLYSSGPLGEFVEQYVKEWPAGFWTMAYTPDAQIIFSRDGVLKRSRDGAITVLDRRPAPIGLAIQATCAMPGFFDAVPYTAADGSQYLLYDGILSWDGICPASFVEEFFGVPRSSIVACDVGKYSRPNRMIGQGFGTVICPDPPFQPHHLNLTLQQKYQGFLAGSDSTEAALVKVHPEEPEDGVWRIA